MIFIALVENDEKSRFTFEQIVVLLRARGIRNELRIYPTQAEALAEIPLERPDVIFVDMRSANGHDPNGPELAHALRQHPLNRNAVIIGMAEYAMPADRTAALAAGCDEFVGKPVRYQTVEELIDRKSVV
jgi:CheY-like chemotaxis protein